MNNIELYEKIPDEEKMFPVRLLCHNNGLTMFMPHWHEHIELLFFIDGESKINTAGMEFSVRSGDLIVVNSNELHYKEKADSTKYNCMILNPSFFSDIGLDSMKITSFIQQDKTVKKYFGEIFEEYEKKELGYKLALKGYAYELMLYLLRNYSSNETGAISAAADSKRLSSVIEYISKHYTEKLTTSTLASVCYLSEFYFCRFFKSMTGCTPVSYINSLRIEKALAFLNNTSASVTEIALAVGFDDVNYFSRVFKKAVGKSPTDYRKMQKGAEK